TPVSTFLPYSTLFRSGVSGLHGGHSAVRGQAGFGRSWHDRRMSEQRPDDERYPLVPSAPGWDERSATTVRLQRAAIVVFALLGRSEEHTSELQSRENL